MIAKSSGKIGDLIYGLPCAIAKGCTHIQICAGEWGFPFPIARRFSPLLSALNFDVKIGGSDVVSDVDLDAFRQCPRLFQQHFALSHCEMLGVDPTVLKKPWIKVEPKREHRIIISRGFRTRVGYPYEGMCRNAGGDVGFVGTELEYEDFLLHYPGCKAVYTRASDLLELARVIAGAEFFMGNQSAPLAIAEAIHHPQIRAEIGVPAQYAQPLPWAK